MPGANRIAKHTDLQGGGVSNVDVATAQQVAHQTLDEGRIIRLSIEDQKRFVELMLNPPSLTPALRRAKKAHSRLITSSR